MGESTIENMQNYNLLRLEYTILPDVYVFSMGADA